MGRRRGNLRRGAIFCVAAALILGGGCAPEDSFPDHTLGALASREDFDRLARSGPSTRAVEFILTHFTDGGPRSARFLDGNFYTLHDEWYWFRLLNGAPVPGDRIEPVQGLSFDSIAAVYDWAKSAPTLPLDLRFVEDGRLYSPRFYDLALGRRPRPLGLGVLVHAPARTGPAAAPERWAFELEYMHDVTHEELLLYFAELEARLPGDVSGQLRWLVRSPQQEELAARMEAEQLPYGDRILRYRDLSAPGEREVYASGLSAGRLLIVKAGEPLSGTSDQDILLLEQTPDLLPPCAGLLTAVPQTPLAHVNFLARNRGIPNVYLGGSLADPALDQLARARAPVVLRGELPDQVQLAAITEEEYRTYLSLTSKPTLWVDQPSLDGVRNVYDLATLSIDDLAVLRPILGGKSAGMLALVSEPSVVRPDRPMAISIKPYLEHLAPLRPLIEELLASAAFETDARARFLILDGSDDFDLAFRAPADQSLKAGLLARYGAETAVGAMARGKGLRGAIRARPMNPATLSDITAALAQKYESYDARQGLRFRSSSNAEDIEGFNGAGLYDSNTGFLDAAAQASADDRKKTVEYALKKTWASYWAPEAVEERRLEHIVHLSGAMGVLVHAQFNDDKERANGVFTYTISPGPPAQPPDLRVLELNVQKGALSVTNPVPGDPNRPEIDRVALAPGSATPRLERVRRSTLSPDADLLDDTQLLSLFQQAGAIADAWLARQHRGVPAAQRGRTLTLDFELRHVAEGWPALRVGAPLPSRVIVKQARSLEPAVRVPVPVVDALPMPRDLRARAARVERRVCTAPQLTVTLHEVYTDPLSRPDLGYSRRPFTVQAMVTARQDLPALALVSGQTLVASHLLFTAERPGGDGAGAVRLTVHEDQRAAAGFEALELREGGAGALSRLGATAELRHDGCVSEVLLASPKEYLAGLLRTHGGR